jgi:hypothetical protein
MTGKQLPRTCWVPFVLAVFLAASAGVGAGDLPGPKFPPRSCPGGVLSTEAGVAVLQVAGSPEVMKLHLAFGEPPTTSGRYVELDARALFAWTPTGTDRGKSW